MDKTNLNELMDDIFGLINLIECYMERENCICFIAINPALKYMKKLLTNLYCIILPEEKEEEERE